MKKNVLLTLATASLLSVSAIGSFDLQSASANGEIRYADGVQTCAITTEEILCTNMQQTGTMTTYRMPLYTYAGSYENCCGPVAGAIVVGYYDRYYENLIPDYTTYNPNTNLYYGADMTYIPAVMNELYTLMRTNVDDVGVSQYDCRNGLQTYVENKDLTLSYSSIESNSTFNFNLYQQAIDADKPVLMFCTNVTLSYPVFSRTAGKAVITNELVSGGHIVVGYGYVTVDFYQDEDIIRTENYLIVSSGKNSQPNAYINISSTSWLVDGYAVTVSE